MIVLQTIIIWLNILDVWLHVDSSIREGWKGKERKRSNVSLSLLYLETLRILFWRQFYFPCFAVDVSIAQFTSFSLLLYWAEIKDNAFGTVTIISVLRDYSINTIVVSDVLLSSTTLQEYTLAPPFTQLLKT